MGLGLGLDLIGEIAPARGGVGLDHVEHAVALVGVRVRVRVGVRV